MSKRLSDAPGVRSRRGFLRTAASGAVGFPLLIRSETFGKNAPSNRITMGIIGCGNQSEHDLKQWFAMDDVQVVSVCDVNRGSHGYRSPQQFLGREPVRDLVNQAYAQRAASGTFKGCGMVADFRELLARRDIDTVAIITPDHWHAIQTIQAAAAGKDIYCQKPLGLTVQDGQEMIRAVRKHNRVLQTGSQWRSTPSLRRFYDLVRGGAVGTPRKAVTYVARNNFTGPGPGWQPMPVPQGFDYDMWLGPAPDAPYHKDRCFYRFRFISAYSGGQTTNFGHHAIGVAMWALGLDEIGPETVWDMGAEWPPAGDLFDTATKVHFGCRYPGGFELECVSSPKSFGVRVEGDKGWIETNGFKIQSSSPDLVWNPTNVRAEAEFFNHYRNFIDCVKSRGTPVESVVIGHRISTICHIGNIAMKLSRKIRWDAQAEQFVGDDEANAMLRSRHRAPWSFSV